VSTQSQSISNTRSLFAKAVKERRLELGITQEELAWRAGLHRTYITDIERGARNLSLQSIERLAGALQASIAELFSGSKDDSPKPARRQPGGKAGVGVDILLVEDNPDDVEQTLQAFRAARMENRVHTVPDGVEALHFLFRQGEHATSWTPHRALVVLLDLNLPKLSGLEVLRRIRSDARTLDLPVVVLTASEKSRDIAECRRLGCSSYIIKPVGFTNFSKITPDLRFDWKLVSRPQNGD
jgi:CheY-like chemotaxis protein